MRKYPDNLSETILIEKILGIDSQFLDNDSIRINTLNILWTTFENCEVFEKEKYHFDSIYPLIIEWLCSQNVDKPRFQSTQLKYFNLKINKMKLSGDVSYLQWIQKFESDNGWQSRIRIL